MNEARRFRGIFISDLDGTLLDDSRTISTANREAFAGLSSAGVLRVIATGRSLYSAKMCLPEEFPLDYLIASTGSHIIDWKTGESMMTAALPPADLRGVYDLLQRLDVNFMIHDSFPDNHCFTYKRAKVPNRDFEHRLAVYGALGREAGIGETFSHASQVVAILAPDDFELYEHIVEACAPLSVIRATSPLDDQSIWVEIFACNVSKGEGVHHLLKYHELDGILTGAIGNDLNDETMLELVHLPYVVENAFITNSSKYHRTPDNNSNAVSHAIAHFTGVLSGIIKI